ncbi:MAG: tyrosine--tRNA ligase [Clostridia bacterium]|nr:tyrosine--tRNA ligase [Clostridia bacterium]
MNVYDVLQDRGFIKQVSHPELRDLLGEKSITFYTGYDPTADSCHVGHFMQLMAMCHMQKAGHKPIILVGGGTANIGDPSGRQDMRRMMTKEQVANNAECLKKQMSKFLDFSDGKAEMVNNADWLLDLNYVDFLRDIGAYFSVNRMLAAECYKSRLAQGLTFLEFNYMLMQSYDFLHLYRTRGAVLELGGDDQWCNILSGADLIRRVEHADAYAMTFQLLTNADGTKMGKTVKGALWLDPAKTSPYEFYQYWRNVEDASVGNCLALLTFLPMEEVRALAALKDSAINEAKKRLALEVTTLVHGREEAEKAAQASEALFGGGGNLDNMPTTMISMDQLKANPTVVDMMVLVGLCKSKGEARRLIEGGGVTIDDQRVREIGQQMDDSALRKGVVIRRGKKVYHRVMMAE